jgi:hypothetical protein
VAAILPAVHPPVKSQQQAAVVHLAERNRRQAAVNSNPAAAPSSRMTFQNTVVVSPATPLFVLYKEYR